MKLSLLGIDCPSENEKFRWSKIALLYRAQLERHGFHSSFKVALATAALCCLTIAGAKAAPPIVIAPTSDFSQGNAINGGLYGSIYNFNAVAGTYSVSNILNPALNFDPTQVGSFTANTSNGIKYGVPNSADSQALTAWLNGDGPSVVYNGTPHITQVFDSGTNQGTLLILSGYIKITPAMVNVVQTFALGLDDGGTLTINGTPVIDNGGIHGATVVTQTAIFTRAGLYPITIGYYDGHASAAVLSAVFGGGSFISTPGGVAFQNIALDPTSMDIQNYVSNVAATTPTDPTFNNAANALAILALSGVDPAIYEYALKELSPLKYSALDAETVGTVDFITNDLDDYLAHRRTDEGTFRPGNGVDLSGLSVFNGNIDPALQDVAGHLLAYDGGNNDPKALSDSPGNLISTSNQSDLDQRWNVFTRGIVVLSQNFSTQNLQHSEATSGTLQLGADYQVTPHFLVGAFFDYAHSEQSLDEEGSTASANSYIPGLYASYTDGGWYANALAAGGVSNFDVTRDIDFPGFTTAAQSKPTGEEEYSYISGGKDFHYKNWTFGPTGGLQYVHMNTDAFTENGAGLLDLNVDGNANDSLRSRLGGRVYYAGSGGGNIWRPFLDASWQHEFMENSSSLTSQFNGAGVGSFTVPTPSNSRESALISVGTDIDISKDTNVFTAYRVEVGSTNFFAQSVEAGVKINF